MRMFRFVWLVAGILAVLMVASCTSKVKEEITLGATFPLSGDNASYGKNIQKGMELGVEEINTAGGINGRKIKVIYLDDKNEPKEAVSNLQQLVSAYKVLGVVGSAGSNCTLALAPDANKLKTVIISPTSSQKEITDAGPYVYRTCPSDVFQVNIIIDLMNKLGYKKVGVLYVTNSWGVAMKDAFVKGFTEKGGDVPVVEGAAEAVTDLRPQLSKISKAKIDAIFMPTYAKQGGRAVKQARELNIKLPLIGGDPWDVAEFLTGAGDAAEGAMYTVFSQYKGKEYEEFAKKFKTKYNDEPDILSASGYDDLHILAAGLKYAASKGMPLDSENMKKALDEMPAYVGATGDNTFDHNGDVTKKNFVTKVYRHGKSEEYLSKLMAK